jgi:hypothetical protein
MCVPNGSAIHIATVIVAYGFQRIRKFVAATVVAQEREQESLYCQRGEAMLFRFCCDESHEGKQSSECCTISGFFSDLPTWKEVENCWAEINRSYGVQRFHAQPLNRRDGEYTGWSKEKAIAYSAELLKAVNDQGRRMRAYNCGMHCDAYKSEVSENGREKLGLAWMVCFNSCVAMIAKDMETLPASDVIEIIVERGGGFDDRAVEAVERLKVNPRFPYRQRLKSCTLATPEQCVGLQVADLMAYEYFKRLNDRSKDRRMRPPYDLIRQHNDFEEGFFGSRTFNGLRDGIENTTCGMGELVVIPALG